MEEGLDEVARGEREWVPLVRDYYVPLRERVDLKRRELRRRDFTTEPSDEVCSEGHPMVIRLGRNGRFLACSLFPEHRESRPLPGEEEPAVDGAGQPCPSCGEGTLVAKRGRFGPFAGCSRYPDCTYIHRAAAMPPPPLPFDVACPPCGEGRLATKRARASGRLFWGCSRYPTCDYTTSHEPLGLVHDADAGPVGKRGRGAICLRCGATIKVPEGAEPGTHVPGGPPNPAALLRPSRGGGGSRGGSRGGARGGSGGSRPRAGEASGTTKAGSGRATRRAPGRGSATPRA
jgi:DNA topoisomerase-1